MQREEVHTAAGPTVKEDLVEMSLGITHSGQVVIEFLCALGLVSVLLPSRGHASCMCFPGSALMCVICV